MFTVSFLLVEPVQLRVGGAGASGTRLLPSGELVESDIEHIVDFDYSGKLRGGIAVLPAGVNAGADGE